LKPYVPKEITEEVNVTPGHPLVDLAYLFARVAIVAAMIYGGLGLVAGQLATRIDPKTEEQIGAALTASFPAATAATDSRVTYLNGLITELESSANLETATTDKAKYPPVKVRILEMEAENAMVTAGSYLFVTDELLKNVESENELAFVLAHELGHLHHRDPLRAMGRSLVFVTLSSLLGMDQSTSALPGMINLAELSYSRNQETDADSFALNAVVAQYGHIDHSLGFFERSLESETALLGGSLNKLTEWQQTHPISSDRISRLKNTAQQKGWQTTGAAAPLPEFIGCPNFQRCDDASK
jgi:beta-barrel assembly-enhancing protease